MVFEAPASASAPARSIVRGEGRRRGHCRRSWRPRRRARQDAERVVERRGAVDRDRVRRTARVVDHALGSWSWPASASTVAAEDQRAQLGLVRTAQRRRDQRCLAQQRRRVADHRREADLARPLGARESCIRSPGSCADRRREGRQHIARGHEHTRVIDRDRRAAEWPRARRAGVEVDERRALERCAGAALLIASVDRDPLMRIRSTSAWLPIRRTVPIVPTLTPATRTLRCTSAIDCTWSNITCTTSVVLNGFSLAIPGPGAACDDDDGGRADQPRASSGST